MANFKKTAALVGSYVLVGALAIGGTLAYLTDTERTENVFTAGTVDIEQLEYERVVENGEWVTSEYEGYGYKADLMQEFTQGKTLVPAVFTEGTPKWDDRNGSQDASGATSQQQPWSQIGAPGSNQLFDNSMKNVQDKFVFVENTGKTNAYYRTVIAVEAPEGSEVTVNDKSEAAIWVNKNGNSRFDWNEDSIYTEIDGVRYYLLVATYNEVLTPGEISRPSLLQVYMRPEVTNEQMELFGDQVDIKVVSQAVQVSEGMTAAEMLDAAFGDITTEVHPWSSTTEVTDAAGLKAAVDAGGNVAVTTSIDLTPAAGEEVTGNVVSEDTVLDFNEDVVLTYKQDIADGLNGTQIAALTVVDEADLTIIDGNVTANVYGVYVKDGTVNINGGKYVAGTSAVQVYYGTANITGGFFECTGTNDAYLLNCIDGTYGTGEAKIVVTGGTFVNFNPNEVIGGEDYVPDGYKVVSETQENGDVWYTVVAE